MCAVFFISFVLGILIKNKEMSALKTLKIFLHSYTTVDFIVVNFTTFSYRNLAAQSGFVFP